MAYRDAAKASYDDKMGRMGLKITTADMGDYVGKGHVGPDVDGTQGPREKNGYADGYKTQAEIDSTIAGKVAKPRLDRPGYKRGGRVKGGATVNVIVAPTSPIPGVGAAGAAMPPGPPPPPPGAMPPPPMPGPPAGMGPMPRKRGGRVPYDAGAGGGLGREEKVRNYGRKAFPGK